MSGFSTAIGFMFSFFVISFTFVGIFMIYQDQLDEQITILESAEKLSEVSSSKDYFINAPYFSSGRLNFKITNLGMSNLYFDEGLGFCFSSFVDNVYSGVDDQKINILKHIPGDYALIERDNFGVYTFNNFFPSAGDRDFKFVSCGGDVEYYDLISGNEDWWDENWNLRNKIDFENFADENLIEYQAVVELNSSNFDFSYSKSDDLRFILPLKESLVLDLTLDNFKQN